MVQTPRSPQVTIDDKPKQIVIQDSAANKVANPPETVKDGSVLTWNARIRVKKFAFNGSFNIHLFIGYIKPDQPERFLTKKNEVGLTGIFATTPDSPCSNCAQQRSDNMIYEDAIPITPALYSYLRSNTAPESEGPLMSLRTLENFEPENVVPFLKANVAWKLTDMASNLIDGERELRDSGLEVSVSARMFELPTPGHPLGVYHPATQYPETTADKIGGFGYVPAAGS
jgi:hypothetical protein